MSVSHSATESEIISLDAGLRVDGLLALDLWDMVIEVLRSTNNTARQGRLVQGDVYGTGGHSINRTKITAPTERSKRDVEQLSHQGESQLYIFEDNVAVIKMIIAGRSPSMRRVSRTRRVALDWLFGRINLDPKKSNHIC